MSADSQALKVRRYHSARRATILSAAVNVALAIGKIFAGIVGHSAAMVADGLHSASDLITDGVVMISMRVAGREADEDHPYGHGKFETLATQFIAVVLIGVALGIIIDAVGRIRDPALTAPTTIALVAAFVSILSKEALFQYTIRVGRALNAKALIANAWHQRSDAISSVAALIGIGGAMMGWPLLDPLAAIAVALILGKVGVELLYDAVKELTDSTDAIDKELQTRIAALVDANPDVRACPFCTARRLGPDIVVDVTIVVDPYLSVSEGHQIAERVRHTLLDRIDAVTDVRVHVDPCDHDLHAPSPDMTDRYAILALVDREIADHHPITGVDDITLHYTPEGIVLDASLAIDESVSLADAQADADDLRARVMAADKDIVEVRTTLTVPVRS